MIKSAIEAEADREKNSNTIMGNEETINKEIQIIYQILQNMDLDYEYNPVDDNIQ